MSFIPEFTFKQGTTRKVQNIWPPEEFQSLVEKDYADVGTENVEVDYLGSELDRELRAADEWEGLYIEGRSVETFNVLYRRFLT